MEIESTILIKELRELTQVTKTQVLQFKESSIEELNYKPTETEWSVLECLEHLCFYGRFYLPEIERRLVNVKPENKPFFKSGILGNYFVNAVKASNAKKMKAVRHMNPTGSKLNVSTLNQFIKQLDWLDSLLIQSENIDLGKVKTSISLTKLLKIKLGDTLRFLAHHNERHVLQAVRMKVIASQLTPPKLH